MAPLRRLKAAKFSSGAFIVFVVELHVKVCLDRGLTTVTSGIYQIPETWSAETNAEVEKSFWLQRVRLFPSNNIKTTYSYF